LAKLEKYSLYLIGLLRTSCPPPYGPAKLFKIAPGDFVSKNLASHFDRSPLNYSYSYASAGDRSNCFASFSLNSDPFMQYAG